MIKSLINNSYKSLVREFTMKDNRWNFLKKSVSAGFGIMGLKPVNNQNYTSENVQVSCVYG